METQLQQREAIAHQLSDIESQVNQLQQAQASTTSRFKACKLFNISNKLGMGN
jgi:hypothetical protein